MIQYIKGSIENILDDAIVIESNGIGYLVQVSPLTISRLPSTKENVKIFTYMNIKEDGVSLFGFISFEDLKMFSLLITVSGIGPKSALGIVGSMTPSQLMLAIITDDVNALSKAPGVGKKTASRLILELKDKIKTKDSTMSQVANPQQSLSLSSNEKQDAIEAMLSLGYSRSESVKAVLEVALEGMTTEQIIKLALKKLTVN